MCALPSEALLRHTSRAAAVVDATRRTARSVLADAMESLWNAERRSREIVVDSLLPLRTDGELILQGVQGASVGVGQADSLRATVDLGIRVRSILEQALDILRRSGGTAALRNVHTSTVAAIVETPPCTDVNWTIAEFASAVVPGWQEILTVQILLLAVQ